MPFAWNLPYLSVFLAMVTAILLSVLRGAAIFMADLARATAIPLEMDHMALSARGGGAAAVRDAGLVLG